MKHKLVTLVLAIVVIASLVVVGCTKPAPAPAPAPSPAPTPAPAGPEEILVGSSAAMTGMFAGFGVGTIFGAQAATDDINKQGGVYVEEYGRKLPVRLIVADNESDLIKAGTLVENLILHDKVNLLLAQTLPMPTGGAPLADKYKIPNIIGGGPLEPTLAMRGESESHWPYTWHCGFAIAMPAPPGDFRHDKPGYTLIDTWKGVMDKFSDQTNKKVGVFASDDPDGVGWYALFPSILEGWGYDVVGEERKLGLFPIGTTDFTPLIEEWKDYGVEILWGNCPGPVFGTLWRQAHTQGFEPKLASIARAACFYHDVTAWGGDLPEGICTEVWWRPSYKDCPGIGGTTPETLFERWLEETGEPLNQALGYGYTPMQILFDAIERAGTLDGDKVNKAIGETDIPAINSRALFNKETQFCRLPLTVGQWQKTDKPWIWECPVVFSDHDFAPATAMIIFPIPYE